MSNDSGLPKNAKLFRYVVYLPSEGGEKRKAYPSVLMTHGSATAEMLEHQRDGRNHVEVIVDQTAALEYQAKHEKRKGA